MGHVYLSKNDQCQPRAAWHPTPSPEGNRRKVGRRKSHGVLVEDHEEAGDGEADVLRPGMSFRVAFTIEGQSYPRLPEAAIIWGGSGSYIWGVDGDTAFRVPVDIVARNEGHVLVRGDLHAGARIITEGVQKVREGSRIVDVGERETGLAVGGSPIVSDETR